MGRWKEQTTRWKVYQSINQLGNLFYTRLTVRFVI